MHVDPDLSRASTLPAAAYHICEAVHRNLRSRTYQRGRYSVQRENGVHHFHGLLTAFLGD